jgi:hypothetical protein
MRRLIAVGLLLGFSGLNVAQGELIVDVGTHDFLPGEVRTIALYVSGGTPVGSLSLYLQVGDGGEMNDGSDTAPFIGGVDVVGPGTIFAENNLGQDDIFFPIEFPMIWNAQVITESGAVSAEGVLAYVTIDATGTSFGETYALMLEGVAEFLSQLPGGLKTEFAGPDGNAVPVNITNGEIRIVPEPSVVVLLSSLLPCLALVFWHRRRTARR